MLTPESLSLSVLSRAYFRNETASESQETLILNRLDRFRVRPDIDPGTLDLIIFDFETTGLDPRRDRIIEIGALRIHAGTNTKTTFNVLINPRIDMSWAAQRVTRIDPSTLLNQPSISEQLPPFLEFCRGALLWAHNAEFDASFLKAACVEQGITLEWPIFCTLKMARKVLPDLPSRTLDDLARHYKLKIQVRHRALDDVELTAQVLMELLKQHPCQQVTELQPFGVN